MGAENGPHGDSGKVAIIVREPVQTESGLGFAVDIFGEDRDVAALVAEAHEAGIEFTDDPRYAPTTSDAPRQSGTGRSFGFSGRGSWNGSAWKPAGPAREWQRAELDD